MTVFSIVNMYLSSSHVFPHRLPPKPMLYFRPLSLSFTLDNIDSGGGGGGGYGVKKECNIKGMKLLIKAHVLNKCFNYFCAWLFLFRFVLSMFTI